MSCRPQRSVNRSDLDPCLSGLKGRLGGRPAGVPVRTPTPMCLVQILCVCVVAEDGTLRQDQDLLSHVGGSPCLWLGPWVRFPVLRSSLGSGRHPHPHPRPGWSVCHVTVAQRCTTNVSNVHICFARTGTHTSRWSYVSHLVNLAAFLLLRVTNRDRSHSFRSAGRYSSVDSSPSPSCYPPSHNYCPGRTST